MNTSNGAQAQIWNFVSGGNQEWNLVRVDPDTAQTNARAEEKRDPDPRPPSASTRTTSSASEQRGQGPGRPQGMTHENSAPQGSSAGRFAVTV